MEILVPLMPMFATLPLAAGAVWIAHLVLRHRARQHGNSEAVDALRDEMEELRQGQLELQERLDVTERVLAQVRAGRELPRSS